MRIVVDPVWMTRNASVFRATAGELNRAAARLSGLAPPNMPPDAAARCRAVISTVPARVRGVAGIYGQLGLGLGMRARHVQDDGRGAGRYLPFALGWHGLFLRPNGLAGLAGATGWALSVSSFLGMAGKKNGWKLGAGGGRSFARPFFTRSYPGWAGGHTFWMPGSNPSGFARMNETADRMGDPWRTAGAPRGWQPTSYRVGFERDWELWQLHGPLGDKDEKGRWRYDYGARTGAFADGFAGVRRQDGRNFAGVEGGVLLGVEAHARGSVHYGLGGVDTAVLGGVATRHGAMANGSGGVTWGKGGVGAGVSGEARLGGEVSGDVGVKVSGATAKAKGELSYGLGVEGAADAQMGLEKVRLKLNAGVTLGVGGTVGFDVSVSPKEVGGDVKDGVVGASKWAGNKLSGLL